MDEGPLGEIPGLQPRHCDDPLVERLLMADELLIDVRHFRAKWHRQLARQRRVWLLIIAVAAFELAAAVLLLQGWMG